MNKIFLLLQLKKHNIGFSPIIILILFLIFPFTGQGQFAIEIEDYKKPDSVYRETQKQLKIALESKDSNAIALCYYKIGSILEQTEMAKSTEYIYKASKIYNNLHNDQRLLATYISLSSSFSVSPRDQRTYLQKAESLAQRSNQIEDLAGVYNVAGCFYTKNSIWDSALYYHNKCLTLSLNNTFYNGIWISYNNLGWYYLINEKQYDTAIALFLKAKSYIPKDDVFYLPETQFNLFRCYIETEQLDSAFYYLNRIWDNLKTNLGLAQQTYSTLSAYYKKVNDPGKAYSYLFKTDSIEDIIKERSQRNQLSILDLEYESKLKEEQLSKLYIEMNNSQNARIFLIISLVMLIVIFFVIFRLQQQKTRLALQNKQRMETEKKLISTKLTNSELHRQSLRDELKYTNKELSSFAASIVKNSDIINDLKESINCIIKERDSRKAKIQLHELKLQLTQLYNNDEQRKDFIKRSRQINHSLVFHLKSHFPQLSDNDLNLIILILLKFSSKEIASLYNVELESISKRRNRLRKKIGLKEREPFEHFMDEMIKDFKVSR